VTQPAQTTAQDSSAAKRVLLVTYPFPPVGGAGVQRVVKFVKYLGRYGWEPTVLTVSNPSVPLFDHSLDSDIPPGTVVRRARSYEPGYATKASVGSNGTRRGVKARVGRMARGAGGLVLQPDPQILWLPQAVREGKRILKENNYDVIFASGPPFSTFLIARRLGRFARLPVVLDYRDEWTISNAYWENKKIGRLSRFIQERMQNRVLRSAKAVIATTQASANSLDEHCRRAGSGATVTWIYNGYDSDDFDHLTAADRNESLLRLVYTGTLWNLTSAAPIVEAVRVLSARRPELAAGLEIVLVGRRTGNQVGVIEDLRGLPCKTVVLDYLDHSDALGLMASADALLLLLSDLPGAGRVVPAKLFEYIATRRPILSVMPQGEAWGLLDGYPNANRYRPGDTEAIASWLENAIVSRQPASTEVPTSGFDIRPYSRDHQASQLADILDSVCALVRSTVAI
jgi:glycosyltransferase involved in cell wall biosynthesis